MLTLYVIMFTQRKTLIVVGSEEGKAKDFISDVWSALASPNVIAMYGNRDRTVESDTRTEKIFWYNGRKLSLAAYGAGQSLRGTQVDYARPDLIIMDDLLDLEDTDTPLKFDRLKRWLTATALEAMSKYNYVAVYLGNMYPKNCLTTFLVNSPNWKSIRLSPILADGSLLWPEVMPLHVLQDKFAQAERDDTLASFYAEVMNMPIGSAEGLLDFGKILPVPDEEFHDYHLGNYVVIDPAGHKATSDANAIGYYEIYEDLSGNTDVAQQKPYCRELIEDNLDPMQVIKAALEICLRYGCRTIFVEGVAYQSTLAFWFGEVMKVLGLDHSNFNIILIHPEKTGKNGRILGTLKSLIVGEIKLGIMAYAMTLTRAREWDISSTKNKDDILDLHYYAKRVMREHRDKIKHSIDLQIEREQARLHEGQYALIDTDIV